jgi:uncharacterized protein YbaR (Trm112 family)
MAFSENPSAAPAGSITTLISTILDQLACPACLGALQMATEALACTQCGRTYPILDGIPILIADRANPSK